MSTSIEAQGHTVDEAIQIALNQLGVSRDKVEIDILHHPRRGVLGIGARRAKVRATIRESVMLDGEEFDMSGGTDLDDKPRRRRRRGGRSRGEGGAETGTEAPTSSAAPRPAPARESGRPEGDRRGGRRGDEGGRGRDDRRGGRGQGGDRQGAQAGGEASSGRQGGQGAQGGQGGRGGQQRGGQQRDQRQPREGGQPRDASQQRDQQPPRDGQQARDPQQPREADGRRQGGRQGGREDGRDRNAGRGRQGGRGQDDRRGGGSGRAEAVPGEEGALEQPGAARLSPPPAPRRQQPVVEEPPLDAETLELVRARADELVRELLEKMGFPAEVTSSVDMAAGEAVVSVRSESEGLLIGRRGQTLDSLEHIVNRMVLRGESYVEGRVLLDIGDYRKRRRESLDELAARLRGRAVDERRSVQVSPMSPRDRKYFAQAFAGDDSVEVRALGAGFYRRVIVAPAGMASSGMDIENVTADNDDLDQQYTAGRSMRAPEAAPAGMEAAPAELEAAPRETDFASPAAESPNPEAES